MAKIKAVVFDLYGTLIYNHDTNPYLKLFSELGFSPEKMKEARKIALTEDFSNLSLLVQRLKPGAAINLQPYEDEIAQGLKSAAAFPETKRVLEELTARKIKLGLISNLASPYKSPFFDLGLDAYFGNILFSCDLGLKKPDSKIYQKMIQSLNLKPAQVLMIGDDLRADVDGPKAIGMQAIHLDRMNNAPNSIGTLDGIFQYI